MRKTLVLLALLTGPPLFGQETAFERALQTVPVSPEVKTGFRDVKLGTRPTADMKQFFNEGGDITMYTRPSDKLVVGDVSLKVISYVFFQNRLMLIGLSTQYPEDLLKVLQASWGRGTETGDGYVWKGADGDTVAMYSSDPNGPTLEFQSQRVGADSRHAREARDKKAKKDL